MVLFLATFIHTGYDHLLFYGLWAFVGGIAASRMVGYRNRMVRNNEEISLMNLGIDCNVSNA
jgi:hypothetical protein